MLPPDKRSLTYFPTTVSVMLGKKKVFCGCRFECIAHKSQIPQSTDLLVLTLLAVLLSLSWHKLTINGKAQLDRTTFGWSVLFTVPKQLLLSTTDCKVAFWEIMVGLIINLNCWIFFSFAHYRSSCYFTDHLYFPGIKALSTGLSVSWDPEYKFSTWPYENILFQRADIRGRPLDDCCHGDSLVPGPPLMSRVTRVTQSEVWVHYFNSKPLRWNQKLWNPRVHKLRRWSTLLCEIGVY